MQKSLFFRFLLKNFEEWDMTRPIRYLSFTQEQQKEVSA
jgi:hypothetical protein